ncbi:MAG: hypothetical protein V4637_02165 [Pseudomonadota bacterium]
MKKKRGRILITMAMIVISGACSSPSNTASAQKVEVVRDSGLRQCDEQKASPQTFSKLLEANGVAVLSGACASDSAMRAQMCGMDRGLFYFYEIDRNALAKALALGFTDARAARSYKRVPCD